MKENLIKSYVVSIFALKIIDIVHLLVCQMSADIFLIDWERPRPASTTITKNSKETNQVIIVCFLVMTPRTSLESLLSMRRQLSGGPS